MCSGGVRQAMKLLVDARALGTKPSGIGIYVYNIICELIKDDNYRIELITDVALSDEMQHLSEAGIQIHTYGANVGKSLGLMGYYRYVQQCIDKAKPDIFWESNTLVPIKIHNSYGKLITTIHDMFPITCPRYYGHIYPLYFRYGIKKTINSFDAIIYNSKNTKLESQKYFPGLTEKNNFVGYLIVPRLPKIPITDNGAWLYVGNLETRKGIDILIRAYERYRELGGKRSLRLVGNIRDEKIRQLYEASPYKNNGIEYIGYLDYDSRNKEYASCHGFIFPSQAEGFGIPIVEILDYYKPVIAGDIPVFREVVGDCISYFNIDDEKRSIEELTRIMLEDNIQLDTKAYDKVIEKYIPENIIKGYKEFFDKITKSDE